MDFEAVCIALKNLAKALGVVDLTTVTEIEIIELLEGQLISEEESGELKIYFSNQP